MKHHIDPKVDCVFKAILGSIENRNLLINFLNAILSEELSSPITYVEIINPYNDKEFLDDKLSIVDVKARDKKEQIYQIEIQLLNHKNLPERMVYTWADIYSEQLKNSDKYFKLKPTYSIWLLAENLLKKDKAYLHDYKLRDKQGQTLAIHGGIWLIELQKFAADDVINNQQRWLKFFQDAESFDENNLPSWMHTKEMEQAMTTLQRFSEKEVDYHAYQARQNFLRVQNSFLEDRDEALQREEIAVQAKNEAVQEKNEALEEVERLKALLAQKDLH
ncbi:MAG: Rpn family recombination-promoting nuclease/putative transposase [Methylococcaceae bacterium]|nr:Rpn family recombination-promoting nuclease/putative transposase [Methylococcaceae bacterium]